MMTIRSVMKSPLRTTLSALVLLLTVTVVRAEKISVGYYTSESVYQGLHLGLVPAQSLTHIAYAFATVSLDGTVTLQDDVASTTTDTKSGFPVDSCPGAISGRWLIGVGWWGGGVVVVLWS